MRGLLARFQTADLSVPIVGDLHGVVTGEHDVRGLMSREHVTLVGELQRAASLLHDAEHRGAGKRVAGVPAAPARFFFDNSIVM